MSKALTKIVFFVFLTLLTFTIYLLPSTTKALNAIPDGGKVPCTETKNPEFNSDRPYQASPCGDSPKALFCSNKVVVTLGTVHTPYCGGTTCKCVGKCDGDVSKLIVDLTDVNLPVLGNTQ